MSETQIYWLITLPKITDVIGIGLLTLGFSGFLTLLFFGGITENWKPAKKYSKWFVVSIIAGALLITFIPSTKELVAIYGIPKVVNNEQVQTIPEKLLEFANIKLDDLVEEAKN